MMNPRWMLFVDGENFTIRSQKRAKELKHDDLGPLACVYERNVCFWPKGWVPAGFSPPFLDSHQNRADRSYYYTSAPGDKVEPVREKLRDFGFQPRVFHKSKQEEHAKGVDVTLTKDMLVHAFNRNYDIAVLVSGDADFVPVVEELQRMGRIVLVSFFQQKKCGMSDALRLASDRFVPFDLVGKDATCPFKLTHYEPKSPADDPRIGSQ